MAANFALVTALAIVTKLSSSVDDVAWLLPYMQAETALVNAALYICLMQAVVWTAVAASLLGREGIGSLVTDAGYWTAERVLSVASGCLLACFTVYLFYDWYTDEEEDENDDDEPQAEEVDHLGSSARPLTFVAAGAPR